MAGAHIVFYSLCFLAAIWHWVYWDLEIFCDEKIVCDRKASAHNKTNPYYREIG